MTTIDTRFRAYQLGQKGASFSYATSNTFTLIEARMTDKSKPNILTELALFGKPRINLLHITSWDQDHCNLNELVEILDLLKPLTIQYPGYDPHTENAQNCLKKITDYERQIEAKAVSIKPEYIEALNSAKAFEYSNIICWPRSIDNNSNNNSTVKIFRQGAFNVASLGDIENVNIESSTFSREVDIITLAHHGADCENNSKEFFEAKQPTVAVCGSNYGNEHEHPRPVVRERLKSLDIRLYTTKTGDVIIQSVKERPDYFTVYNLCSNSEEISSKESFWTKKYNKTA